MRFVDKIKIVKVSKNSDILNQKPKKNYLVGWARDETAFPFVQKRVP